MLFVPFRGVIDFFELAPLSDAATLLFLGFLTLVFFARLPGCALERKERISPIAIFNSASTSACTASSCASAGFSGAARDPFLGNEPNFASEYSLESS